MITKQRNQRLEQLNHLQQPTPRNLALEFAQQWVGPPVSLSVHKTEGWTILVDQYQILLERAIRHSAHQLYQQLQAHPGLSDAQIKARASHQVHMVLRCAVADQTGSRYPYFYHGLADQLCLGQHRVAIPHFTQLLLRHCQIN